MGCLHNKFSIHTTLNYCSKTMFLKEFKSNNLEVMICACRNNAKKEKVRRNRIAARQIHGKKTNMNNAVVRHADSDARLEALSGIFKFSQQEAAEEALKISKK